MKLLNHSNDLKFVSMVVNEMVNEVKVEDVEGLRHQNNQKLLSASMAQILLVLVSFSGKFPSFLFFSCFLVFGGFQG